MRAQAVSTAELRHPPDHVAAYRRDGFAVVRGVFSRGEVAELARAFDRQRAEALRRGRSWRHGNLCYRLTNDPAVGPVVTMAQWAAYADPVLARLRNDPRVLDIMAPLVGRDLKQIINQCHWKPPGAVTVDYNFHQDVRFRRPRSAFRDIESGYVQTAIAVDPHRRANGAVRFVPGSHRLGEIVALGEGAVLGEGRGDAALRAAGIDPASLVDLALDPGDVAMWHPFAVHGSGPSAGGDERRFYLNSYVRADSCDRGEWAFRDGKPVALGQPVLVHYEELYTRPGPHYLDAIAPPPD
jgi:hypothetical protein